MIKDELKKFPPGCIGGEFEYKWDKYIQTDGRIVDRAKQLFYFEESRWISHRSLVFILKRRGISFKEWYDYHYLPRDENGEYIYPKCKYCKIYLNGVNMIKDISVIVRIVEVHTCQK